MVLNSLALKLNGIDRQTRPRVDGVEIVHDADGEPTGVIIERNYTRMAGARSAAGGAALTFEERTEGLRRSLPMYHEKGTTSVYEGHGCASDVVAAYRELWERNELSLRSGLVLSPAWLGTAQADYAMRHWMAPARGQRLRRRHVEDVRCVRRLWGKSAVQRSATARSW